MYRRLTSVAAALALPLVAASTTSAHADAPIDGVGPTLPFTEALLPEHGPVIPLKNAAKLNRTRHGYLYRAGQQNSHLVVTRVATGLRFRDSGTQKWSSRLPGACHRQKVRIGVAAVCTVPATTDGYNPMLLEIWPRLGNDYIDGRTLTAAFQMAVLADAGRDNVHTGAGRDFINGAQGPDRASGGDGNDWIRTGIGNDRARGDGGDDYVVGADNNDVVRGGLGHDRVYGGAGHDRLYPDAGTDFVVGGTGRDTAYVDDADRVTRDCETVHQL